MGMTKRLPILISGCLLGVLVSGCGSGPSESLPARSAIPPASEAVAAQSALMMPLSNVAVDDATDPVLAELDGVYPQLRNLKTFRINAPWTPENFRTLSNESTLSPAVTNPFLCGKAPYSGDTQWTGNTPPNCTPSGVFAGVYSNPNYDDAASELEDLPGLQSSGGTVSLPSGSTATAFGFIYIEAWEAPGGSNIEAGLAFAAGSNAYYPYIASLNFTETPSRSYVVQPNTDVYMHVGTDDSSTSKTTLPETAAGKSCSSVGGCIHLTLVYVGGTCPGNVKCEDNEWGAAKGFTANCCIFRRMTTIAVGKNEYYDFYGGYSFEPIQWVHPYTAKRVPGGTLPDGCTAVISAPDQPPCSSAYFDEAGSQAYPQSAKYVQQSDAVMDGGETDWVYFP